MRTCPSCNGVIGIDCFNPMECAKISMQNQGPDRNEIQKMQWQIEELSKALNAHGIKVDINPQYSPSDLEGSDEDWLPF